MKYVTIGIITIGILSIAAIAASAPPQTVNKQENLHAFMKQKLSFSQSALEGIVIEDYDKVAKNGQSLSLLSLEAGWQVLQTEDYVEHSAAFRKAANRLTTAGREKNLDAAALAYVDMTMRCVECHRYVRSHKSDIQTRR